MSNKPNISTNMGINSISGIFTSEPNLEELHNWPFLRRKRRNQRRDSDANILPYIGEAKDLCVENNYGQVI